MRTCSPGFARVQHDGVERRVQFLAVAYTDANHSRLGFVRQVGRLNLDDDRIAHICRSRGGARLIVDQALCDDRNTIGGEHRLRLALGERIVRRVLDQLRGTGRGLRAGTPYENARAGAAAIVAPMPCGNAAKAAVHRAEHRDVRVGLGFQRGRSLQPIGDQDVAGDLAVALREFAEGRNTRLVKVECHRLRHDQRAEALIGQQRIAAGPEGFWIVDDLRRHVAGIARGAEVWNVRFENRANAIARLRQRHPVNLRFIGRHDGRPARGRCHRDAAAARRRRLGEERGRLHQRLELVDHDRTRAREGRAIGGIRSG